MIHEYLPLYVLIGIVAGGAVLPLAYFTLLILHWYWHRTEVHLQVAWSNEQKFENATLLYDLELRRIKFRKARNVMGILSLFFIPQLLLSIPILVFALS